MKVEVGLWWVGFFDEEKDVQWRFLLFVVKALAPRQPALRGEPSVLPAGATRSHGMRGAQTGI